MEKFCLLLHPLCSQALPQQTPLTALSENQDLTQRKGKVKEKGKRERNRKENSDDKYCDLFLKL